MFIRKIDSGLATSFFKEYLAEHQHQLYKASNTETKVAIYESWKMSYK